MPEHFWLTPRITSTPPQLLSYLKVSTSYELAPTQSYLLFLFEYLDIQFLIPLPFPNAVSQATFGYLPLTVQRLCNLQDVMPCQWSPSASHTTSYLGKQRISLGATIILSICFSSHTQLDCNQFTMILSLYLSMSKLKNKLLVVKTSIKNIKQQPH